jgi:hypothetical protein
LSLQLACSLKRARQDTLQNTEPGYLHRPVDHMINLTYFNTS